MTWLTTLVLLFIGLALIVKGGDTFVDAAAWMAEKTGIPKLVIGATIVSIATTLPEILVSTLAAAEGKVDMAIGNAVGSVSVNIGIIMGIALICMPAVIQRKDYLLKSLMMIGAALVLVLFGTQGSIGLPASLLLAAIFIGFMMENVRQAREATPKSDAALGVDAPATSKVSDDHIAFISQGNSAEMEMTTGLTGNALSIPMQTESQNETLINILKFIFGAAAIVIGSQLLVDNGSLLASILGVPERIIAVTVVAMGTSLPEFVTTLTAIAKQEHSLSIGNIIGANIIDLTLILPLCSIIGQNALPVSPQFASVDLPFCLFISCLALVPAMVQQKFSRWQGVAMVVCYIAYLLFTIL